MTNTTMKICVVGISLSKGGAERSISMMTHMLSEKGHDVHLVLLNNQIDYSYSGTLFNLGLLKNAKKDSILKRLKRFKKFRHFIKRQQFDFIIDHRPKNNYLREQFYHKYLYKGIKKIYVLHSSRQALVANNQLNKFIKIHKNNYANVAVSNFIESDILKANGLDNSTTIYNAFDPNWKITKNVSDSPLKGKTYILSYGRIDDSIKDFRFLISAFSKSDLWKQNIYLVILGDGKDKEALRTYAKQQDGNNFILFHPFTPNPFPYIYNSKFVTLTSKYEGFPMVLLESLSVGIPVIALDIKSGPSEIIINESNGLLIAKRDVDEFANAMHRMFDDETLYQHCKSNALTSVTMFSKAEIAAQWEQLLKYEE